MDHLDTLARWLGWLDLTAAAIFGLGIGLPSMLGRAPRGMVRFLYFGIGFVVCRHDLQPLLCERLRGMGYLFVGRGRWRLALALPGKVRRRARAESGAASQSSVPK